MRKCSLLLLILLMAGCASTKPSANVGDVAGNVDVIADTSHKESGIETRGGAISGPVSTIRYGLDEGMVKLLQSYGSDFSAILGKAIACVMISVGGLVLWALYAPSPGSGILGLVGQVIGIAMMVGGPIAIWLLL